MFEIVAFTIFSILTISMFLITVLTNNTLYALSSLAAGMIFISGFFFLLDAEFLGVVQIVVYSGAVMALYAFGMMFFDTLSEVEEKINNPRLSFFLSGTIALIIVIILIAPVLGQNIEVQNPVNSEVSNSVNIGLTLFTKYLLPFEMAALMLLIAMIGAIVLASKKMNISFSEIEEKQIDKLLKDNEAIKRGEI
ncbi:NADH:quinone oxidoreductase I, membrane subunit J [Aliarcobacter faecis]|uniref:NADH-quinone oxidoreductase subunit J n=1 Tax=Aliarcobacter faecis TaxID=1564138 RepID=UPI00047BC17B|nr:NADH-quinone oxidoreductase subunit J [Aliarcobacter faecis]QKF72327.1 NADH:quinone oxidoreductase I, membrane subunit J [Aliarcobacter faecis]